MVSYFDKLIQVPLRVPPLGVNEVRAYLLLLFAENAAIPPEAKAKVSEAVNDRLAASWQGLSVDAAFVSALIEDCPTSLKADLASADRLARQMASSKKIAGNPRLIKRFLNTLSIRRKLATAQNINVDSAILAKLLLFERCAAPASFEFLVQSVTQTIDGKPPNLRAVERAVRGGAEVPDDKDAWSADETFVTDWLKLDPPLADALDDNSGRVAVNEVLTENPSVDPLAMPAEHTQEVWLRTVSYHVFEDIMLDLGPGLHRGAAGNATLLNDGRFEIRQFVRESYREQYGQIIASARRVDAANAAAIAREVTGLVLDVYAGWAE